MKKAIFAAAALASVAAPSVLDAKGKATPTALELHQLQSRDIEATKDQVFGAVMSVLQDSGYRIQAADKDTGLITGLSSTKAKLTYNLFTGFGKSKKSPIVSAFIEQRSPSMTSVRLSFVMAKIKSNGYGSQPEDEEPIYDPTVYQQAFEQINQTVFIRKGMAAPAATAASPAAPVAPAPTTTH